MTKIQTQLRLIIITLNVILLLSLFSITITTFAYGIGKMTYLYLALYPLLVIATILAVAKLRLGFIFTLFISLIYCFLLTNDVGYYFIFNLNNYALFWVIALPYFLSTTIISLTTIYLSEKFKLKKSLIIVSLIICSCFIIYPILDRYEKEYTDTIFVNAEINKSGFITLNCKPGFADSRFFVVTNNSNELQNQIKKYGEYYQGGYFLSNTVVSTYYKFDKLISVTIVKINNNKLNPEFTWKTDKIKGETDFLTPHN
jgi:hypothetical protein